MPLEIRAGSAIRAIGPSPIRSAAKIWHSERSRFGSDVNLGNIAPSEVLSLETLRLGLRSDTLAQFHGG